MQLMEETTQEKNAYGKRPMWQWIALYLAIAVVLYGAFYYFVLAKKGGYNYNSNSVQNQSTNQQTNPTTTPVAKNSVQISNFSFSPATLTVKVGDAVTWTNQDSMGHSATADDKSFDTGLLDQGKSGKVTFSKAGTYTYHCSAHTSMYGTIIVQ